MGECATYDNMLWVFCIKKELDAAKAVCVSICKSLEFGLPYG